MQFLRVTTRRWMLAIALAGFSLGGWRLAQWREYCLTRAELCARLAVRYRNKADAYRLITAGWSPDVAEMIGHRNYTGAEVEAKSLEAQAQAERCLQAATEFRHASLRPWSALPPEPAPDTEERLRFIRLISERNKLISERYKNAKK